MLNHIARYAAATDDKAWLRAHGDMVLRAGDYICGRFNPQYDLIYGVEEANDIDEQGREIDLPGGYSTHINTVCAQGLRDGATLAALLGAKEQAKNYRTIAGRVQKAIEERLFDEKRGEYLFGLTKQGHPLLGTLWFKLMPAYVPLRWNERDAGTFWKLWKSSYNLDPKIPGGYWGQDFRPVIGKKESVFFRYSGVGPYIGVSAAIAHLLLLAGEDAKARQQIEFFCRWTNQSNLIPEHINTINAGRNGNCDGLYPHGNYYADSGNLFQLSFFLRLAMHYPHRLGIKI